MRSGPQAAEIRVEGTLGYAAGQVVSDLMELLSRRAAISLRAAASADPIAPGSWCRLQDDDPTAHPGRVRLMLESAADARRVADEIHGKAIQVGPDLISISVSLDVPPASNRRGGTRGGAASPDDGSVLRYAYPHRGPSFTTMNWAEFWMKPFKDLAGKRARSPVQHGFDNPFGYATG